MSKLAVASSVVVVGGGGSVTVAYALGAFENAAFLDANLEDFKKAGGRSCVQSLFPGLELKKEGDVLGSENHKITEAELSNDSSVPTGESAKEESCLVVNWERSNYTGNKWDGNLRFAWAFRNKSENKGFVMFTLAKPKRTESGQQLDLTGGFYYVTKTSANKVDTWSVSKYYELPESDSEAKKITASDFESKFFSVGQALSGNSKLGERGSNWGFVSENNSQTDLGNICLKSDKCSEKWPDSRDWFRGYWTWESVASPGASEKELSNWSRNFTGWLENIYSKSSTLDLSTVFTTIKGKWN